MKKARCISSTARFQRHSWMKDMKGKIVCRRCPAERNPNAKKIKGLRRRKK